MFRVILAALGLIVIAMGMSCGSSGPAAPGSANDSPTEAYKRLYAAVKGKDTEAIKRELTEKSLDLAKTASAKNNTPIDKVYENGLTETTFSPTLPEIRDQRLDGGGRRVALLLHSPQNGGGQVQFVKVHQVDAPVSLRRLSCGPDPAKAGHEGCSGFFKRWAYGPGWPAAPQRKGWLAENWWPASQRIIARSRRACRRAFSSSPIGISTVGVGERGRMGDGRVGARGAA